MEAHMLRRLSLSLLAIAAFAAVAIHSVGTRLIAQSTLAQFKLTDADAAKITSDVVLENRSEPYHIGTASRELLKKTPSASRGPITRAFFLWSKAYLASAAFKKEYAAARAEREPKPREYTQSIDEEVKEKIAKDLKDLEEGMKNSIGLVPPNQRPAMEETFKQMQAMLRDPKTAAGMRMASEETRKLEKERFETEHKQWQTNFPADPQVVIARRLREFLALSDTVDFGAQLVARGDKMAFANPEYEQKPSEWKSYYRYGKESIAAAREAAEQWLKEIGSK
jgi:hypothetical protein